MQVYNWLIANLAALTDRCWPSLCLLCGAAGEPGLDLCAGCRGDLPANDACCRRCALPIAGPAAQCGQCLRRPPPYEEALVPWRYAAPLDALIRRLKYSGDLAAARTLALLLAGRVQRSARPLPQLILPMPLHRRRLRERGFNQAAELARPLSRRLGVPMAGGLLQRVRHGPPQAGLDAATRRRNLRGAFRADPALAGTRVALLDDVVTTGSTVREAAAELRRAGVAQISVWALTRV